MGGLAFIKAREAQKQIDLKNKLTLCLINAFNNIFLRCT